ncbi:MAG: hypothetical protein GXP58_05385 [Deltaproteobacteria bacterium]|nr:hypothetical protein [Deltaproteobacteria bacterium]
MYAEDPALSIELLEQLSRKEPENLAFKLTLAEMYEDRGRVNDAVRLWFEILDMSRRQGDAGATKLPVYSIAMDPGLNAGIRPYGRRIDKSMVYAQIGRIYFRNAFFLQAAEYYSTAAACTEDLDRKADFYNRAGMAVGSQKVEDSISNEEGNTDRKAGDRNVSVDPAAAKLHRELAFYEMAAALPVKDADLAREIRKNLIRVGRELVPFQPPAAAAKAEKKAEAPPPSHVPAVKKEKDPWKQASAHFRAGEMAQAVALWDRLATSFSKADFLIEVELDCENESLKSTFIKLHRPDDFFLLSRRYQGRTCYRLCLGLYPSRTVAAERLREVRKILGSDEARLRNAAFFLKAGDPPKGQS